MKRLINIQSNQAYVKEQQAKLHQLLQVESEPEQRKHSATKREKTLHSSTCWQSCIEGNVEILDTSTITQ